MSGAASHARKRVWRKVIVVLIVGVAAIGALMFWKKNEIALWYMERNKQAQETAILFMLDNARPIIARDLKMTLPEKIFSSMAGRRNEKERQTGALKDVRGFAESGFANHWLKFRIVHNLGSVNGFDVRGFDFALDWNRGNAEEVLSAFNVNFLKREIGDMHVNDKCSFFSELRLYIEKRAKVN